MFSVSPVEGIMEPGQTQDFTVTFSPDHESLYFSDQLRVVLFKKVVARQELPSPPSLSPLSYISHWAQGSQKNKGQPDQSVWLVSRMSPTRSFLRAVLVSTICSWRGVTPSTSPWSPCRPSRCWTTEKIDFSRVSLHPVSPGTAQTHLGCFA